VQRRKTPQSEPNQVANAAVIYVRVSSQEQEREGFSIDAQLHLLRQYAHQRDIRVLKEFCDVETAKRSGRSEFSGMLRYLAEHRAECNSILVEKTDRLYRNFRDYVSVDDLAVHIHFVKENVVLSQDSHSHEKFMHGIKVVMAKGFSDNLSEETSKGMLEKARQGIWPSYAPLGYRNVTATNGKKHIAVETDSATIIRSLFERYASGNYSLEQIAAFGRQQGLMFRKSRAPVTKSTIHSILKNRLYTGDFDWDGETYRGTHEPIVSTELWERVQLIMGGRYTKSHPVKHNFAFSGLVTCGHCGCALVAEIKKNRYVYYHCTGYKGRCPEPYTREEILEAKFGELLAQLQFDEDVIGWVKDALHASHAEERRAHDEAVRRLRSEHQRLQQRLDVMYVDKLDGKITADFYDRNAAQWRNEQDRLQQLVDEHQSANRSYIDQGIMLLELANNAYDLFQKQSAAEKRRLLNFVLSNCTWRDGTLKATYRQPFDLLAVTAKTAGKPFGSIGAEQPQNKEWLLR
jgi:DNA invertase Pin-like site-specific DNA recombinase